MSWLQYQRENIRIHWRDAVVSHRSQEVAIFRTNLGERPTRVPNRGFELFHRSRPLRMALQVIVLVAIAAWTIKNYIQVLHSL